jgi:hypothetical protein
MHTYRRTDNGHWQAGYQHSDERFNPLGPAFVDEGWAAAYAAFLNGGRFNPDEIEHIFGIDRTPEVEDDDSTYPRPEGMDYEPEPKRAARK